MRNKSRVFIAIATLLLFYVSGFIGLSFDASRNWFLAATPLNLVLTTFLFLWANKDGRKGFLAICALIYVSCFFVEVAGVHTRAIFGIYNYGKALGTKWLDVPLLIGANWLLLVLTSAGMVQELKTSPVVKWVLGALLMVGLDWVIEPIAMQLDFWQWQESVVPLQNYVAWFVVSFLMHALLHLARPVLNPSLSTSVFLLQVVFFSALHLTFSSNNSWPEAKYLFVLLLLFSLGYSFIQRIKWEITWRNWS
jgi:putative membrane protein